MNNKKLSKKIISSICLCSAVLCIGALSGCKQNKPAATSSAAATTTTITPDVFISDETSVSTDNTAPEDVDTSNVSSTENEIPRDIMTYEEIDGNIVVNLVFPYYKSTVVYQFDENGNMLSDVNVRFFDINNMTIEEVCEDSGIEVPAADFTETDNGYEATYTLEDSSVPEEYRTYDGFLVYCEEMKELYKMFEGISESDFESSFGADSNSNTGEVTIGEYSVTAFKDTTANCLYVSVTTGFDEVPADTDSMGYPDVTIIGITEDELSVKLEADCYSRSLFNNMGSWNYFYSFIDDENRYYAVDVAIGDESERFHISEISR